MKVIDTMRKNWSAAKEREAETKRLKAIERSKKDLKLSDEDVREIIKLIGEQNPSWAQLDPDLLGLFLSLAIKQYKPKEEDFNLDKKEEMRQQIADIFNGSSNKVSFNVGGQTFRPNLITPNEIKQLNDAYTRGKGMGSGFKNALKSAFKKKTKNI